MACDDSRNSDSAGSGASIKYRYAGDEHGRVVDIGSLDVVRGKDYVCLSCRNTLRPVLGEIRQKHFRHKQDVDCSQETYLHNLAKVTFYETYLRCLETNTPFLFEYPVPRQCTYCEFGPCEIPDVSEQTDLTEYFREIFLEQRDGEFIPDVLLAGEQKLYIEIVVTHYMEQKKRNSGVRIVEITVSEEEDVEMIRSRTLSLADDRVCAFNLRIKPVAADFNETCSRHGTFFHLDVHGAARLVIVRLAEIPAWRARRDHFEDVYNLATETFHTKLAQAFNARKEIRHCWLCVYCSLDDHLSKSICNRSKQGIGGYWPTKAVECEAYKMGSDDFSERVLDRILRSLQGRLEKPATEIDYASVAPHPADWNGKCEFCGKITTDWWTYESRTGKCKCNDCLREGKT